MALFFLRGIEWTLLGMKWTLLFPQYLRHMNCKTSMSDNESLSWYSNILDDLLCCCFFDAFVWFPKSVTFVLQHKHQTTLLCLKVQLHDVLDIFLFNVFEPRTLSHYSFMPTVSHWERLKKTNLVVLPDLAFGVLYLKKHLVSVIYVVIMQ